MVSLSEVLPFIQGTREGKVVVVFRSGQDGVGWRTGRLGQRRRVGMTGQPCSRQLCVWMPGAPSTVLV